MAKSRPEGGIMATTITRNIIESYLNCRSKGYLKTAGQSGKQSDYEAMTTLGRCHGSRPLLNLFPGSGSMLPFEGVPSHV